MSELRSRPDIEGLTLHLLKDDDDAGTGERRRHLGDVARARFPSGLTGGVLRRIRAYIDAHIGEHISLDDLARQAGISRFHFARQFRLTTGESPMAYLRRVRIERSKSILQSRETTIAEIAATLGFSDQSHFTRTFGRLVGVSPGSFARSDDWRTGAADADGGRTVRLG
jgi:AraC family transcriptional regulator